MESQPKITVYYDGVCNLCSGLMDTIGTSSKGDAVARVDITKGALPAGVTQQEALHDMHVLDSDGRMYKGADAVLKIMEQYSHLAFLVRLGRMPVLHTIAEGMYRVVEKTRYWIFGRKTF